MRWLPAKPAAPVTSTGPVTSAWDAAQGAAEGGEVAEPGERERHEEAPIDGHRQRCDAAEVVGLVFERDAAALRVVEAGDPLLQHRRSLQVVIERIQPAEAVVARVHVARAVDVLRQ